MLPLKRSVTWPGSSHMMKASCFSAVAPVMGRNQWVKWVQPSSMAHSFMARATLLATSRERGSLRFRDWRKDL